ncbi:MAG: murein transglycosylase A [Duodenibacillus sp.]
MAKQFIYKAFSRRVALGAAALSALLLAGCAGVTEEGGVAVEPELLDWARLYTHSRGIVLFRPTAFSELPATNDAHWRSALTAFRKSCARMSAAPAWRIPCEQAQGVEDSGARLFFEVAFDAYQVAYREGGLFDTGLTTGYYEPMLRGSRTRQGAYRYPLYGVPDDLIEVDLAGLYPQTKDLKLRGKVVGRRLVPYDTREAIEKREDLKRSAVLCWVDDPVEAFLLQIQGSGRVALEDGSFLRLGYADNNGHPYKAVGSWLIKNAGLKPDEMSMQRIKAWARENPSRTQEMLRTNPRFVFFAERNDLSPDDGPVGAQGVPLTPEASVAVDRRFWSLGTPFVIEVEQATPALQWARPVVAQDTGSAIRGPIRFDYFWGYGDTAGAAAGGQKSVTRAWVLLPKGISPEKLD